MFAFANRLDRIRGTQADGARQLVPQRYGFFIGKAGRGVGVEIVLDARIELNIKFGMQRIFWHAHAVKQEFMRFGIVPISRLARQRLE